MDEEYEVLPYNRFETITEYVDVESTFTVYVSDVELMEECVTVAAVVLFFQVYVKGASPDTPLSVMVQESPINSGVVGADSVPNVGAI